MKKILIGLIAMNTISSFAGEVVTLHTDLETRTIKISASSPGIITNAVEAVGINIPTEGATYIAISLSHEARMIKGLMSLGYQQVGCGLFTKP